jgi:aldehyde dehydrogenase (NAD+)
MTQTSQAVAVPSVQGLLEALRSGRVADATAIYLNGAWAESLAAGRIDVMDPATEQVIAQVSEGCAADVDRAVAAARAALPAWSALTGRERGDYLRRVGELLAQRLDDFGALAARDLGATVHVSKLAQLSLPVFNFNYYATLAAEYDFDPQPTGKTVLVKEPIGVIACITPWNFPLHQTTLKVAAALAAGCTVVLKPSEVAPLLVSAVVSLFDEVGLPAGVLNVVHGTGTTVGEPLVAHANVDMISFTGSTRAGKRISEVAAGGIKRVALELGGKSASVILDDADLTAAISHSIMNSIALNCGQACVALTRVLVPSSRLAEAEAIAAGVISHLTVGSWDEPGAVIGPVASRVQHERVTGYIQTGIDEGAKLVTGGVDSGRSTGYFVAPTLFSEVTNDMVIAREEIFGPVIALLPYESEAEAIAVANDTIYGLSGAVWSGDQDRAIQVARRLQTGQVLVNGGAFDPTAPFGGYKQSGLGREAGTAGLEEFLETKSIQL